jgi:hypothetical protein
MTHVASIYIAFLLNLIKDIVLDLNWKEMKIPGLLFLAYLLASVLAKEDGLVHEKGRCVLYGSGLQKNMPVTYVSNIRSHLVSIDDLYQTRYISHLTVC